MDCSDEVRRWDASVIARAKADHALATIPSFCGAGAIAVPLSALEIKGQTPRESDPIRCYVPQSNVCSAPRRRHAQPHQGAPLRKTLAQHHAMGGFALQFGPCASGATMQSSR